MTRDQVNAVLERVRSWPPERQEDAAQVLLAMEAQSVEPYELSPEERAEIAEALAEVAQGEFATEAEVATVFSRYGR